MRHDGTSERRMGAFIQEALSNTRKHALATRWAAVLLDYGPHSLRGTVTDDGRPGAAKDPGTGHGLIGNG
ncbi:hypothetical protein ACFYRY_39885 [Streptomyces sp. NPDC005263]|uniref:hypothetical protein n=1 Tax=Streptomyces sp. NPDC005263 TaxID=3364711 RepID=UPI00368A723A